MKLRLALLLCLAPALAACDSSEIGPTTAAVYVGNQGIFSENSGSVTVYDPETGTARQGAIPNLGGLVQRIVVRDGRAYVLLNFNDSFTTGRGRIDVVDLATNERTAQIDVSTPRQMAVVGTTGYVTSLYANTVTPVNLTTNTAGTPIPVGANPEGVVAVGSRVHVANAGFGFSTTVSVINAASNAVVRTIEVGCDGPRALEVDGEGEVWVFCSGRTTFDPVTFEVIGRTNGEVVVLDGATGAVVGRIALPTQLGAESFGQDTDHSASRREVYAVAGGDVLRFDTATNALAATLDVGAEAVAAVAYDEASDRLYLGRLSATAPNPYAVAGRVSIHDRTGAEVGTFAAGVVPAAIAFAGSRP